MRKIKVIALYVVSMLSLQLPLFAAPVPVPVPSNLSAKAAIVIEASTGKVLYEKNAESRMFPASTTKEMTIITALEAGNLDDIVTVSKNAASTEGSSMDLVAGEQMRLGDMLYGLALVSGNDATVALAEHTSGSVQSFAQLMTTKARAIGAMSTNFTNSSGLPDPNHYTTAHDLARIAAYGYKNPEFVKIVSTIRKDIPRISKQKETFYNENKLLQIYDGSNGVKTGYTDAAGRCLVSAAKRGNVQLIAVVLDADYMWQDSMALLDYGFSQVNPVEIAHVGNFVDTIKFNSGNYDTANLTLGQTLIIPIAQNNRDQFHIVLDIPKSIDAPVVAGQKVDTMSVMYQDTEVAKAAVLAKENAGRKSLIVMIKNSWGRLLGS